MFYLVTCRAQCDESFKGLYVPLVVIAEDFVALDGPLLPSAATDLTPVASTAKSDLLQSFPYVPWDV